MRLSALQPLLAFWIPALMQDMSGSVKNASPINDRTPVWTKSSTFVQSMPTASTKRASEDEPVDRFALGTIVPDDKKEYLVYSPNPR